VRRYPWKAWIWPKIARLRKERAAIEKEREEYLLAAEVDEETGSISTAEWDFPIGELDEKIEGLRQQQLLKSAARWHVHISINAKDRWTIENKKRRLTDQALNELRQAIFQRKIELIVAIASLMSVIQAAGAVATFAHYDPWNSKEHSEPITNTSNAPPSPPIQE
jgi:hypothetical protein